MADLDDSLNKLQMLKKRPNGVTSNEWREIQKGVGELRKRKDFDPKQHKAQTQSHLATMFIKWYFFTLLVVLAYAPIYNWIAIHMTTDHQRADLVNVKDVFMMVSAAITPILAFVLGHYFKGKD
jgi:hypothetical protein